MKPHEDTESQTEKFRSDPRDSASRKGGSAAPKTREPAEGGRKTVERALANDDE